MNRTRCIYLLLVLLTVGTAFAVEPPQHLTEKSFQHPDMNGDDFFADARMQGKAGQALLEKLGTPNVGAVIDLRSGRLATYMPSTPMVPGTGLNNDLSWGDFYKAQPNDRQQGEAAWQAVRNFIRSNSALGIDVAELANSPHITVYERGEMIHIHAPRMLDGVPVRDSYVKATVRFGNLILFGANKWSDRGAGQEDFVIDQIDAERIADARLGGVTGGWGKTEKLFLTLYNGNAPTGSKGYRYAPIYSVKRNTEGEVANWEVLVDARTGKIFSIDDTNEYSEVKGGVLPVTNDGINPDGVEQAGWPMPFADVGAETTDTGGNFSSTATVTTDFYGPYVNINDNCGASSLTGSGVLDWGTGIGTDCDVPSPNPGGPGNTHASRTGFYELNKIIEMGRGQLPGNTWLTQRLVSNMNINATCNAFWNGTVNFYRSGGGCFNTGEIAGVFDHEWGHGMDANDATPGIASPSGEGIADIYTALRLNSSCIGRNFRSVVCSGNGNTCNTCTGVRDIDYAKKSRNAPHTYTYSNANCGGSVHCVGHVYSEAVWSLWKRNLQQAPYNYDNNTAHEIVTRLTFIGAGNVGTWFSGGPPSGGCAGTSGYQNYLAADDDNGNLNDGTPHMGAIYAAFNDQEIACATPTVQDSGCAGGPTAAPTVTATSADTGIDLSWTAVANATEYEIFRTEGVFQCDFGKVKIGSTTGTTWSDTGLQNDREYSYVVIPKGSSDSCFGPASSCTSEQPGKIPCSIDADCNDGDFCNGTETCQAGFCEAGTDPCANNPTWTCDDVADVCVPECNVDADCDDGSYCNGAEVCNAGTCEAGSDPCGALSCDETCDSCDATTGPQNAAYDAGFGAPACDTRGSSCDTQSLVDGRAGLGPESNQPNTLDACADGTSGTYHSDESNDRVVVSTVDGKDFTEGATVQIDATVWAWSTGSSDTADFYYAADANNPSWTYIGSESPSAGGAQTLSVQYTLPAGDLQAVRVNFRYSGSAGSCTSGSYDDRDDLVFRVGGGTCSSGCTVDADCDDGAFCNGAEVCNAGTCEAGTPPSCDDGVSCTVDTCNEGGDVCDNTPDDSVCDNGAFCDGSETCDAVNDCQAGTPPVCVFGCDEAGDTCFECSANGDCDDGLFCNGAETCAGGSCAAGTNPCAGDCDEANDICISCAPVGASCTDNSDCCGNKCRGKSGSKTCK